MRCRGTDAETLLRVSAGAATIRTMRVAELVLIIVQTLLVLATLRIARETLKQVAVGTAEQEREPGASPQRLRRRPRRPGMGAAHGGLRKGFAPSDQAPCAA